MRRQIPVSLGVLTAIVIAVLVTLFATGRVQFFPRPYPGMPAVINRTNLYSEAAAGRMSPNTAGALPRVYVPNVKSGEVYVIDPATLRVVDRFNAGRNPQHVVPSWDLRTLWVAGSAAPGPGPGALMSIDPRMSAPGKIIFVPDAYNLYFTPDGHSAIVVAEQDNRLDFRDAQTMKFQETLRVPECKGINHADFAVNGRYAIFTCEFGGNLAKVDIVTRALIGIVTLPAPSMPQDIRIAPDGSVFYVADMLHDGVFLIDGDALTVAGFIPTGIGAHGLTISRDSQKLYVANRGAHAMPGPPHGPGSISVIDFTTRQVERVWKIPGGGSPDMGNVSADGRYLWLSGRFDDVVYRIDTRSGLVTSIPVGDEPHGLTVWPQPGRYSLGHTGIMR